MVKNTRRLAYAVVLLTIMIYAHALAEPAKAQETGKNPLPKQGKYTGKYGWHYTGTPHEIEKGHVFIHDIYEGTFFNDAGEGFLHESSVVCPATTDLIEGKGTAQGYCIFTDKDGEKAFITWKGKIDPETGFNGDFQWTGGTGKYTGIQGNNTFRAILIGPTKQGRGIFEGEWKLP
jgi:hypothetical protein